MKLAKKPYNLLLLIAIALLVFTFFPGYGHQTVDIHLHDAYLVIGVPFLFGAFAALMFLLWTIYLVSGNYMYSTLLTWLHAGLTIILVIIFTVIANFFIRREAPADVTNWEEFENFRLLNQLMAGVVITLLLCQVLLLVNLSLGLIRQARRGRNNR